MLDLCFHMNPMKILVVVLLTTIIHSFEHEQQQDPLHDLPPKIGSDDISYFSNTYDIDGLHWALTSVFSLSERNLDPSSIVHSLPQDIIARGGGSTYTTEYKLTMDLEQMEYLLHDGNDVPEDTKDFIRRDVIPIYRAVLKNIPPLDSLTRTGGLYAFRKADYELGIDKVYNKAIYIPQSSYDESSSSSSSSPTNKLLNPSLSPTTISHDYHTHGIAIVDDLLSPSTLASVRRLLLESTVWYETKMPLRIGGYAGAYIDDGLYDRLLLAIAYELHQLLPTVMTGHDLKYLWSYRYDSRYDGINIHADQAAVNVNIWITPDEANLDDTTGGLVVFTAKPPPKWDFESFNTHTERVVEEILRPTGFRNVTVPYRQNRAIIFDSMLFHHTQEFTFKEGYENRRINLTILYGEMQRQRGDCSGGGGGTRTGDCARVD